MKYPRKGNCLPTRYPTSRRLPISLPSIRHAVSVPEYGSNPGTRLGMICLHVPVKGSRDSNSSSSLAFFEGGGKQPVVYNLRH